MATPRWTDIADPPPLPTDATLGTIGREWTRIGLIGFGGPPAHITLLRRLVVEQRGWLEPAEFEDANAACGLLPGPASTQLSIFCALRVGGSPGALVGGLGFIVPAVVLILALSVLFLGASPPVWVRGAGAGASAAVPAVALAAAWSLLGPSHARVAGDRRRRRRWFGYLLAGGLVAALSAPYLVLVLVGCGALELGVAEARSRGSWRPGAGMLVPTSVTAGGIGSLAWMALKVGALSFGGGFVIVPLMQADAVHTYHWMSASRFLDAVALGQVTPGPVVATVAAVGYAAHGLVGGVVAALVAFTPSFVFVLLAGRGFARLRVAPRPRAFLDGAGPAAIGAIAGAAVTLSRALSCRWQFALLAAALVAVLALRRSVVLTLVLAGVVGAGLALAGGPLPG